jgi:hypothetical protein
MVENRSSASRVRVAAPSLTRNIVVVGEFRRQPNSPKEMTMARAQILMAACAVMLAGLIPASGAPFAHPAETKSQVQKVDHQRCWIEDGDEVCRVVADDGTILMTITRMTTCTPTSPVRLSS